jgi:hypothetical protein
MAKTQFPPLSVSLIAAMGMLPMGITFTPIGASAQAVCYSKVYQETYVPGTSSRPGYVKGGWNNVAVPCYGGSRYGTVSQRPNGQQPQYSDDNVSAQPQQNRGYGACTEGAVIGGLLGGGIGAAASKPSARLWAIPLGAVLGGGLGCAVDRR